MKSTWIVVADNTCARIFTADTPASALAEIESLAHLEGRLHDRDMTTDLSGRMKTPNGVGHAFEPATTPKKHEADEFASRLAKHLEAARSTNRFEQLLIVAEPSFLGLLRNRLPDQARKAVCFELDKNITGQSPEEIRKHLPAYLPNP